jgi:hypothetical protein
MTVRYCDGCGKTIADPEIGESLVFNESSEPDFKYDLCDTCGQKLFQILDKHEWSPALAQPPTPEATAPALREKKGNSHV